MARRPTELIAPERVLLGFAILCVVGMLVVAVLARASSPSTVAIAALGLEALVCVSLAVLVRDLPAQLLRPAAMIVAAALTIPVGYFFGPNSSYGAFLTLILLFTGIVTARAELPRWAGWVVAGMICLGQLGLVVLTAARVLDDRSLAPLLVDRAAWSAVCAHLALQSIYAAAFLLGRAVQRRYHRIVDETIAASRRALIRTALLAEARGRAQPRTEVVAVAVDRWFESFRSNVRAMDLYTMAIVAFGVILLIAIVRDPFALYLSLASLVVMAPEQIFGAPVDARTDLYSAGLVFFRVITGRSAFVDRDRFAGPPDPRSIVPLDEQLALALRIALASDPADRFASAAELRDAMIGALTGRFDERLERRGRELLAREPWGALETPLTGT